ncbi:pseudouridine synthase family protein [Artemisia annua]|uniref:Pseudouridine synthase family protein n=1 Tax=Artemisia annua TaxID=35608 RepID=A0A2U1PL81_ARTAN|nr:pseudouridine synthase family protein [Artemisia annua]
MSLAAARSGRSPILISRFHLCKENKDTQEALGLIGKMLGVQPRSFGFYGTKDKRAVTTQRASNQGAH